MNIVLARLWQVPRVVRTILLHPHLQDVDSILTNDLVYVLSDSKEIFAYAVVRRGKHIDRLKSVFTFPKHRGKGCATFVVKAILQEAHQPLLLTCKEHMVPFYRRLGFRASSRLPLVVRLRLLFCNGVLSALYPHRWYAMTYVPRRRSGTLNEHPKLRRLARQRLWSR